MVRPLKTGSQAVAKRYLITSALPYINGIKHLGNLVGSMLPADVFARYQRARGHEVLFICATDEHGTPAELAAAEAGQDVAAYCAEQHRLQAEVSSRFGLSFDHFGRSSSRRNHELTQHFAARLEDEGLIEERTEPQIYSAVDGRFLPDRYVEGTCPKCGFERARGDQCDNCGSTLDPTDLIAPRSKISGSTDLETRETNHLYLLQDRMQDGIRAWVDAAEDWPPLARSIAYKWLDEGLMPRAITRDLAWGIPVARDGKVRPGYENKVFYVWFDAPIEYIGATREWADATGGDWQRWWRTDQGADDVTYVQFMGKDNVAFHTVSFPATMLGSREPWKLVDRLKAFNWLNWYGGKFSTSENRGVFMDQALALHPADTWRWYLMSNAPESSDASFSWEQFRTTVNGDLVNVLGNFTNRILSFAGTRFEGRVPDDGEAGDDERRLARELRAHLTEIETHHEAMEFRKAAAATRALWAAGNEYLTRAAPWTAIKTDPARAAVAVRTGLSLIALFARVAAPMIPDSAGKMLASVGAGSASDAGWPDGDAAGWLDALPRGAAVANPGPMFARIDDELLAQWETNFPGG